MWVGVAWIKEASCSWAPARTPPRRRPQPGPRAEGAHLIHKSQTRQSERVGVSAID
jgi:hypothetical protein